MVGNAALLALEVALFWDTTDEVVDESEVTDDLVTMEDVVDATEDVVVEDDAFTVEVDFVATDLVVTGFGIGLSAASLGAATHDEMSDEIRSAIVSTTSVDENER